MTAKVVVRAATESDLPVVKAIYDGYVADSIATFDLVGPGVDYWAERLPIMYVAGSPDVVGFAYASTYRARPAYDGTLEVTVYLAPDATGQGIGRLLYDVLLDRLDADGIHTTLAVIALPNPASVALHESFGFVEAGLLRQVGHKFDTWIDTAFYQRLLRPQR